MEGVTFFCDVLKEMMLIPVSTTSVEDDNNKNSSSSSADTDTDTISDPAADTSNLSPSKYVVRRHLGVASDDSDTALGLNDESEEFTVFVPTDAAFAKISTAFEQLSDKEAGRVILFHFYKGMMLTSDTLACGEKIMSMNEKGDASRTKCSDDNKYQNGNGNTKTGTMPEIATADILACNGVIHTLDAVMFPVSLSQLETDSSASASASSSDDSMDDDYDSSGDMSNVTASKSVLRGDLFMG